MDFVPVFYVEFVTVFGVVTVFFHVVCNGFLLGVCNVFFTLRVTNFTLVFAERLRRRLSGANRSRNVSAESSSDT